MLGLNLNEATDWQRRLLEHIYVYDAERTGTVLLFDDYGDPPYDITKVGNPLRIPIEDMKPENREALYDRVRTHFKNLELTRFSKIDYDNINYYSYLVIKSAEQKILQRPPDHLYTPTKEEQRQILRVFIEMNKYPEATHLVYNDDRDNVSPTVLVTLPGRNKASCLSYPYDVGGFFSRPTIGIVDSSLNSFRFVVAEELLHALDDKVFLNRPEFSEQDCQDLRNATNTVNVLDAYVDTKVSPAEIRILRKIANFIEHPLYKDNEACWDTELFAKLANFILLRRHMRRNSDTEQERIVERQLFNTSAGKAVIAVLDKLQADYETIPEAQRTQAERFTEQAADIVETQLPHSTYYQRIASNPVPLARYSK